MDATTRLLGGTEGAAIPAHNYCQNIVRTVYHTSYSSCFRGHCWWTVSCCIPGYDGNSKVTVLLHNQIACSGATVHCYHDIVTTKPTVIFHEGVSDDIIVHRFSSWLCPGEGDGGGVRGGATEGSRGGWNSWNSTAIIMGHHAGVLFWALKCSCSTI